MMIDLSAAFNTVFDGNATSIVFFLDMAAIDTNCC